MNGFFSDFFVNRNILVTGATGGIGEDICLFLDKMGANLIITSRSQDKLNVLSSKLKNSKSIIYDLECEYNEYNQREERAKSFIDEVLSLSDNRIDGFVCNAGIKSDRLSVDMAVEEWDKVININLTAAFLLNKYVSRAMIKRKSGSIVNITSIVGHNGCIKQSNYSASKAGLTSMSKSFALEYALDNIRNNCIAPGYIKTPMTDKIEKERMKSIINKVPMQRRGNVQEISPAVAFLLSDYASFITGETLHINGGMRLN
ncbi:MAG: SDR family oxidoreductase [Anaplasmataceae bacterium]|nr:SDR family oxidoreductase [Anaplasmataceae bacterium]